MDLGWGVGGGREEEEDNGDDEGLGWVGVGRVGVEVG